MARFKKPTAAPPQDRVPFLLGQLGTLVVQRLREHLKPHGSQPRTLAILTALAHHPDGVSSSELSDILLMHRSAVVSLVDELEANGYLVRRRNEDDRRMHALQITDAGRAQMERLRGVAAEFEADFLAALSNRQAAELLRLLQLLAASQGILHVSDSSQRKPEAANKGTGLTSAEHIEIETDSRRGQAVE